MTVYELIQQLATCQADALVHFRVDNGESLKNEFLHFEEVYEDCTDVDIRLFY